MPLPPYFTTTAVGNFCQIQDIEWEQTALQNPNDFVLPLFDEIKRRFVKSNPVKTSVTVNYNRGYDNYGNSMIALAYLIDCWGMLASDSPAVDATALTATGSGLLTFTRKKTLA